MNASEFQDRAIVITGGGGVLCSAMARALAKRGARIAILQRRLEVAEALAAELRAGGATAIAVSVDVLDRGAVEVAAGKVMSEFGRVDGLINGAGGSLPQAATAPDRSFFDMPADAIRQVVDLNLMGTIIPSQIFGRQMVAQDRGVILNVASMSSLRPLTRTVAYSAAKAAVYNFTQWLAVHIAQEYSHNIRVNAIAPGFFVTEQNHYLLVDEKTGDLTPRGKTILAHTPQGRFGVPEDLVGAVLWLMSDSASFVHGALIPIDGGFNAFGGV
jgi:NAD(P)-dependent dehydrogenase (short-subunit alcohol dehydrogenase family)